MKQTMNPKVDGYIRKSDQWQDELQALRKIILSCELTEQVKWRQPCYTFENHNVIIIGRFKEACVLSFVKGALLKDGKKILKKPGENTQAARTVRFTSTQQIAKLEPVLKAYICEAIELEKAGLKVKLKKHTEYKPPEELKNELDGNPTLKTAFEKLTPGRQRAYILYISSAKQSKTRTARLKKHTQRILDGKGIDDE